MSALKFDYYDLIIIIVFNFHIKIEMTSFNSEI